MAEPYEIKMGEPARKTVIVLEGDTYRFRKPKKRWLMKTAAGFSSDASIGEQAEAYERVEQLILRCLSDEDRARLEARLDDPDDVIDVEHMFEIMKKLMGDSAGAPPTPPTDSSGSPPTVEPPSPDGQSLAVSASPR